MTETTNNKPAWLTALAVDDEEYGYPKSLMLYGKPGTRKTSLAASLVKLPSKPRVLLMDIDQGSEALINDDEILAAKRDGRLTIVSIDPTKPSAFADADYILKDMTENDYGFDFFIIDTLNVLQEVAVQHFLETTVNSSGKKDTQAGWGQVGVWTNGIARGLHNAKHVVPVFIMHEKVATEETGFVSVVPKLQGGARDTIAGIPSIVANLSFQKNADGDGTELVAILGDSDIHVSKNRFSRFLSNRMTNFDLIDLYAKLDVYLKPGATQEAA